LTAGRDDYDKRNVEKMETDEMGENFILFNLFYLISILIDYNAQFNTKENAMKNTKQIIIKKVP
jgi:hypothetical protein